MPIYDVNRKRKSSKICYQRLISQYFALKILLGILQKLFNMYTLFDNQKLSGYHFYVLDFPRDFLTEREYFSNLREKMIEN